MRHRIAGNRINMPEARRRAAMRSMIDGLILHEHITTTEARAKAVRGAAEHLISQAINGHKRALAHIHATVSDTALAQSLWDLAGEANFDLDTEVLSNEDRATQQRFPIADAVLKQRRGQLADRKARLLKLIRDPQQAGAALRAAREGRALEVHARRTVMRHAPNPNVARKLFSPEFFERFAERQGGYTRITRVGRRVGDASEMVRFELIAEV